MTTRKFVVVYLINQKMEQQIIPKEKRKTIRQELNIEKWPIFTTSTFKGKSREFSREITLGNGDRIKRKVTIGKTQEGEIGVLRIADYKIFNALIKLWEEVGRPSDEDVNFTIHNIAKALKLQWGRSTYKHLHKALEKLKVIPITWEGSFYQKETNITERLVEYFNILDNLTIFERRAGDQLYFTFSRFRLNSKIIGNLLHNYSKPVYLDVILGFKKEISVFIYRHIDLIMADKNLYERRSRELFSDLELGEYKYPSKRKQLLEPVLEELEGAELSTGMISQAKLEKTTDGKDWKVVFRKAKKNVKGKHEKKQEKVNGETNLVIELFNKRYPEKKGTLKEEVAERLIKKHSLDKVMLHISRISNDETVNNPVGLLRTSLEKEWDLKPTQDEIQQKEKQARDEREKGEKARQQREKEEFLKTKSEEERLNRMFFSLSEEEQESMKEEARRKITEEQIENNQQKTNKFLLMDVMVMIRVREMLKGKEELNKSSKYV